MLNNVKQQEPLSRIQKSLLALISVLCCSAMDEQAIAYRYVDGSGNLYLLSTSTLEYQPVQANVSSSGIYSSGKAVTKNISHLDYQQLKQKIQAAINNPNIHIKQRLMGSGMIIIHHEKVKHTVLLSQQANEKIVLEQQLKQLLKNTNNN